MRRTPFPPMACGICGAEFTPSYGQYYDRKEGRIHVCSKPCERRARQIKAHQGQPTKIPLDYTECCPECGSHFTLTKAQRGKYRVRLDHKRYCGTQCRLAASSKYMKRRAAEGRMPVWGTPAQREVARKLGEYSSANVKRGRDHPKWKTGLYTVEMLEAIRIKERIYRFIKEGASQ